MRRWKFPSQILLIALLLQYLIGNVIALECDFQYITDLTDNWELGGYNGRTMKLTTIEKYTKVVHAYAHPSANWACGVSVKSKVKSESAYWSFVLRGFTGWADSEGGLKFRVYLFNSSGGNLGYFYELTKSDNFSTTDPPKFVELIYLNKHVYTYENGELWGSASCNEMPAYIKFWGESKRSYGDRIARIDFYIDDVSNEDGYIIALGEYEYDHNTTEFDDEEIDVEYTTNQYYDSGSEFKIVVRRLITGGIVNETVLSNANGVVIFNRTELFGKLSINLGGLLC